MNISEKIQSVNPSITLGITSKAKAMKAAGEDVVSFGAGEPDFDTPDHIKQAAIEAVNSGFTKYTPSIGIPKLREAICEKLKKENGIDYEPAQIVVSCGAKHSLYSILQTICNPGDEVVIPSPYWVSYPEMAKLAGAVPVFVDSTLEGGLKITPEALKKSITDKTKAVIINSPSNPTGVVYTKGELEVLTEVILNSKSYIVSDEIYEKLIYGDSQHASIPSFSKEAYERTCLVNGVSKSYSMTGWRIGYLAVDKDIAAQAKKLQDHSTSNPSSISQMAALAAISGPQDCVGEMRKAFDERRGILMQLLDDIEVLSYVKPEGAFYLFCNISKTGMKSMEFAEKLLAQKKVAVIPGIGFGWDDFIRLSFATSEENIREGIARIKQFVKETR